MFKSGNVRGACTYFAIFFVLFAGLFIRPISGQIVFFDQFGQTAVNPIVSSGDPTVDYTIWTTVTPVTAQAGTAEIVINSSSYGMIKLMAGDNGTVSGNRTEVSAPLLNYGDPFKPILSANEDKIVWIFTAKQNRSSTGGTQGFNTFNSGLKPASGTYCVGLARFENGLSNYTILAGKLEAALITAVEKATHWVLNKGYRNVIIEINNECNVCYDHDVLKCDRVYEEHWVKARARYISGETEVTVESLYHQNPWWPYGEPRRNR